MIKGLMRKIMIPAASLRLNFVATLRSTFGFHISNVYRSVRSDKRYTGEQRFFIVAFAAGNY